MALSNRTYFEGALTGSAISGAVVRATGESLVVHIQAKRNSGGTAEAVTSVVWDAAGDNQTMTLIDSSTIYGNFRYSTYRLNSPTSVKTGDVTVNFAGPNNSFAGVSVAHITGADTSSFLRSNQKLENQLFDTGNALSQTISSATGDMVLGFLSINDLPGGIAAITGQTNVVVQGAGTPATASSTKAGAASVTMGWTTTNLTTYENVWFLMSIKPAAAGPSTGVTLSGPSIGVSGAASTNFTVGVTPTGGTITGTVVVTPSDSSGGGTFSPTTVSLTSGSPTGTFTYTPASTGAKTISVTNDGSLTNPSNITYTATTPATGVTMTGPTSGATGVASTNFTLGVTPVGGTISGTVVVTPSDGGAGGTFTPTTKSLTSGTPTGTFTYTPSSAGAKTISVTNNGSLTNPSNITYTASSAAATAIVVSGPSTGTTAVASSNFTASANGVITGTVVITPAATGCTFSPSTVSISSGSPTATFTCTAASAGAKTISFTNNGSLTNQSNLTYTASDAVVDATFPLSPPLKYVGDGATRIGLAVHAYVRTMAGAVVGTKTGLTLDAASKVPAFTISGYTTTGQHRITVVNDADSTDFAEFVATAA